MLAEVLGTCLQWQDIPQARQLWATASDQRVLLAFQAELGALQKSSLFLPAAEARPFSLLSLGIHKCQRELILRLPS